MLLSRKFTMNLFYRSLIGLIFITSVMLAKGVSVKTQYPFEHLNRSLFGTMSYTMWFFSMGYLPLGTSTTLNFTAPLFIAAVFIVTALYKREKAPWLLGLSIAVGFAGVCLIMQPSVNDSQLPYALVGLAAGAMGPIIYRKIGLKTSDLSQVIQGREPKARCF